MSRSLVILNVCVLRNLPLDVIHNVRSLLTSDWAPLKANLIPADMLLTKIYESCNLWQFFNGRDGRTVETPGTEFRIWATHLSKWVVTRAPIKCHEPTISNAVALYLTPMDANYLLAKAHVPTTASPRESDLEAGRHDLQGRGWPNSTNANNRWK